MTLVSEGFQAARVRIQDGEVLLRLPPSMVKGSCVLSALVATHERETVGLPVTNADLMLHGLAGMDDNVLLPTFGTLCRRLKVAAALGDGHGSDTARGQLASLVCAEMLAPKDTDPSSCNTGLRASSSTRTGIKAWEEASAATYSGGSAMSDTWQSEIDSDGAFMLESSCGSDGEGSSEEKSLDGFGDEHDDDGVACEYSGEHGAEEVQAQVAGASGPSAGTRQSFLACEVDGATANMQVGQPAVSDDDAMAGNEAHVQATARCYSDDDLDEREEAGQSLAALHQWRDHFAQRRQLTTLQRAAAQHTQLRSALQLLPHCLAEAVIQSVVKAMRRFPNMCNLVEQLLDWVPVQLQAVVIHAYVWSTDELGHGLIHVSPGIIRRVASLSSHLMALKSLVLHCHSKRKLVVSQPIEEVLVAFTALETLTLSAIEFEPKGPRSLQRILEAVPQLKALAMVCCMQQEPELGALATARLPGLTSLRISLRRKDLDPTPTLRHHTKLRMLVLKQSSLGPRTWTALRRLRQLTALMLHMTHDACVVKNIADVALALPALKMLAVDWEWCLDSTDTDPYEDHVSLHSASDSEDDYINDDEEEDEEEEAGDGEPPEDGEQAEAPLVLRLVEELNERPISARFQLSIRLEASAPVADVGKAIAVCGKAGSCVESMEVWLGTLMGHERKAEVCSGVMREAERVGQQVRVVAAQGPEQCAMPMCMMWSPLQTTLHWDWIGWFGWTAGRKPRLIRHSK